MKSDIVFARLGLYVMYTITFIFIWIWCVNNEKYACAKVLSYNLRKYSGIQ